MWSWRDSNPHPSPDGECSVIESTTPAASSSGPPYPSRIMARTPIGLTASIMRNKRLSQSPISWMLSHDYLLRQRDCSEHGSRPGYRGRTLPVASAGFCRKSVAYYYLAANMSMNLLFAPVGGFALAIVPFRGCSALELHGWPSSREAMKLTKTSERSA